jgi:pSer/pThr/pTyr-binding forkhead associated (FHA) protein
MPPLAAIERFFERLFERPSARLFRTRLQPVQVQRRIERAMEAERLAASDRTLVPNRFVVHLHPSDLAGFEDIERSLATELADAALLFARAHHYTLVDRPRVDLLGDPTVERSDIRVDARFADPIGGRVRPPEDSSEGADTVGDLSDPLATMVFAVPRPSAPRARLRVTEGSGATREVGIGAGVTIGRATDNDLVLRDERVSRHHGRIAGRRGTLVYSDLESTNGSEVNGHRVTEVVLGAGDRIHVGSTTLEVEVDEAPS